MSQHHKSSWSLVVVTILLAAVPAAAQVPPPARWSDPGPHPWLHHHLAAAKAAVPQAGLPEAVDQCVADDMALNGTPGAAVAVMVDGQVVYEHGYGVRSRATGNPVTSDTIFRIASVTKQMTAAAVLQQVEDGLVDLDDPVTDYVPELGLAGPWPADLITVRQLLTHTAGMPDQVFDLGPVNDHALSDWAASQGSTALHAPPGAFYNYSNPNYALAGLVLERASGMTYRAYLPERLWGPAGLDSMTFDPWQAVGTGDYATGYYVNLVNGQLEPLDLSRADSGWMGPAGLAMSNARDLVRWAELLMEGGGAVLAPASAEAMQAQQVWMHQTPALHYGYGVINEGYPEVDFRWHDGSWIGWSSMLLWQPEQRFAVAVLANTATPLYGAVGCILGAALDLPPVELPDLTTDPATWRRYAGQYHVNDVYGGTIEVTVSLHGDQLMLDAGPGSYVIPGGALTMTQGYLDTFFVDTDGDTVPETDLTFIAGPATMSPTRWLRNRYAVGVRSNPVRLPGRRLSQP